MIDTSTVIEALYYILSKIDKADKIKLIKLIYLADKYHLIHYGRTITNDEYYAMEYGPVGSTVKDVLSFDSINLYQEELAYAEKLLEKVDSNTFIAKETDIELEMLSETDIEALNFVIEKFASMNQWKLKDYTHKYPEWYQHEYLFRNRRTKREKIDTSELFSLLDNDPIGMPENHIEESKKILTGNYD